MFHISTVFFEQVYGYTPRHLTIRNIHNHCDKFLTENQTIRIASIPQGSVVKWGRCRANESWEQTSVASRTFPPRYHLHSSHNYYFVVEFHPCWHLAMLVQVKANRLRWGWAWTRLSSPLPTLPPLLLCSFGLSAPATAWAEHEEPQSQVQENRCKYFNTCRSSCWCNHVCAAESLSVDVWATAGD